jgi:hypothetical protein
MKWRRKRLTSFAAAKNSANFRHSHHARLNSAIRIPRSIGHIFIGGPNDNSIGRTRFGSARFTHSVNGSFRFAA